MAEESRLERPTRNLDLSAWNPADIDELAVYLWDGDDRDRKFGKGSKLVRMQMDRSSNKLYFNWTLQQNGPTSVTSIINHWKVQGGKMQAGDQDVRDAGDQTRSNGK